MNRKFAGMTAMIIMIALLTGCTMTGQSTAYDTIDCALNTDIDILEIDGIQQACYRESQIHFVVDNTGTTSITGLHVYLEADYNVSMTIKKGLEPSEIREQNLHFGKQTLNGVKSLTISPLIGAENRRCTDAAVKLLLTRC